MTHALGDQPSRWQRADGADSDRVSYAELFFDLVFVYAVTQLSGLLEQTRTIEGVAQMVVLGAGLWWLWISTTTMTNQLDPRRRPVVWCLIALMLIGLALSSSIPAAFTSRGALFAAGYVLFLLIRHVFVFVSLRPASRGRAQRTAAGQISWLMFSGLFWGIGAALPWASLRVTAWACAVAIDYTGSALRYRLPWAAPLPDAHLRIEHYSDRAATFVLIALGESVVGNAVTLAGDDQEPLRALLFLVAFAITVALWLIYFAHGAAAGRDKLHHTAMPERQVRAAYTYIHVVLIVGIVIAAYGCSATAEAVLSGQQVPAYVIAAGPIIYLAGVACFKRSTGLPWLRSHLAGVAVLAAVAVADLPALGTLVTVAVALGAVVIVEDVRWKRVASR